MEKKTVWQVFYNSDRNEGRGGSVSTNKAFSTKQIAESYLKSNDYKSRFGVQGTEGSIYDVKEVVVYEDYEGNLWLPCPLDIDNRIENKVKQLREQALEKLTKEEIQILGIKV